MQLVGVDADDRTVSGVQFCDMDDILPAKVDVEVKFVPRY